MSPLTTDVFRLQMFFQLKGVTQTLFRIIRRTFSLLPPKVPCEDRELKFEVEYFSETWQGLYVSVRVRTAVGEDEASNEGKQSSRRFHHHGEGPY